MPNSGTKYVTFNKLAVW